MNKVIGVIVALIVGAAGAHICAGLWDDSRIPVEVALAGIYNKADNAQRMQRLERAAPKGMDCIDESVVSMVCTK